MFGNDNSSLALRSLETLVSYGGESFIKFGLLTAFLNTLKNIGYVVILKTRPSLSDLIKTFCCNIILVVMVISQNFGVKCKFISLKSKLVISKLSIRLV